MKRLVDTQAFLWFVSGDSRLSAAARQAIEEDEHAWCISAASVWEMAIKSGLARLTLPTTAVEYIGEKVRSGLQVLAIDWSHAAAVERLPPHHRDPFDRLIIAQALDEGCDIITRDAVFRKYGVTVIW
ncbi:MAG: type II toxin-antitoxin system VapC family toxin [Vicinamibacterales bacterium]